MAKPIVEAIDRASKDTWPHVAAGVAQTHRSMLELSGIAEQAVPKVEEWVARGGGASIRRRKICEETIWVMASLGWLRTGGERDAIMAAKAFSDAVSDADASDDELAQLEDQLVDTIKSLPEYVTTPNTPEA